ncbi:hypothetical protein ACYZT9_06405 [Pseudomonas sp. ZT5P21]
MIKLKQRITNPMTVIAIFATLSETSAALSLPFLDNKERELYIWFLISFPFYLLLLFFATLNFNYRSLYAPSDFEKGKHFIKVMDNAERPDIAQGTPDENDGRENLSVQHHIELPERLKDLYIIDARWVNRKIGFRELLERIRLPKGDSAQVVVFLINVESENLLKENALKFFRHVKKRSGAPFCIAYSLSSQDVTVIDQLAKLTRSGQ